MSVRTITDRRQWLPCSRCHGTGGITDAGELVDCVHCGGYGLVPPRAPCADSIEIATVRHAALRADPHFWTGARPWPQWGMEAQECPDCGSTLNRDVEVTP